MVTKNDIDRLGRAVDSAAGTVGWAELTLEEAIKAINKNTEKLEQLRKHGLLGLAGLVALGATALTVKALKARKRKLEKAKGEPVRFRRRRSHPKQG